MVSHLFFQCSCAATVFFQQKSHQFAITRCPGQVCDMIVILFVSGSFVLPPMTILVSGLEASFIKKGLTPPVLPTLPTDVIVSTLIDAMA